MAIAATTSFNQDDIARDQEQQAYARELRLQQVRSRRLATSSKPLSPQSTLSSTLQSAKQLQEALKQAKNIKNVLTIIGGITSFSVLGILWTLFQWNIQMIWTIFGLPGKDFIGLPVVLVPVVIIADLILFIIGTAILVLAWAVQNPVDASCALAETAFGQTWYVSLLKKGATIFGACK